MDRKRRRKPLPLTRKILFASVTVVLFFCGFELLLRAVYHPIPRGEQRLKFHVPELQSRGYDPDAHVFWKLKKNFTGQVSGNHPWQVRINSHRMRNPEVSVKKAPDTIRIVSIGDSSAFGWGVREEETYARRVEAILNGKIAGRKKVQVINAGVPGYSSYQGLQYLRHNLLEYEPDILLAYFGLNDLTGARYYADKEQQYFENFQPDDWLRPLVESRTYQLVTRVVAAFGLTGRFDNYFAAADHYRVDPRDMRANYADMKEIGGRHGFSVYFIAPVWHNLKGRLYDYPYWSRQRVDILGDVAPRIDVFTVLTKSRTGATELFMDGAHPTALGHDVYARTIAEVLIKDEILEGP